MEPIKVTLCEHCDECPEVEISDQGVTIGEDANVVRLSHAEWNELVRLKKKWRASRSLSISVVADQIRQRCRQGESSTANA